MTLVPACGLLLGLLSSGVDIEPSSIEIGMFYGGTTIRVTAAVEAGDDAVVVCHGQPAAVELKQKGKVWGLLWMNVGEVSFENVPAAYLLASSAPLSQLANRETLRELELGYDALAAMQSEPDRAVFGDLIALKESERLFASAEGELQLTNDGGGAVAELFLPAKAPPGAYQIDVYRFVDGAGERVDTGSIEVTKVGAASLVTNLAQDHGLVYGILAVVIALVVGLLTGLVFGLGSKGGH